MYSIRFLDWTGGLETQAKYFSFMSRHIDWPDDVFEGTPTLQKHDLDMADFMSKPNDTQVQSQRQRKRRVPVRFIWRLITLSGCITEVFWLTSAVLGCSKLDKAAVNVPGLLAAMCIWTTVHAIHQGQAVSVSV